MSAIATASNSADQPATPAIAGATAGAQFGIVRPMLRGNFGWSALFRER